MQKAIKNFIDIQSKLGKLFDEIKVDIDEVKETAIQRAKQKQRREWRRLGK